jgi:integrase
VINFWILATYPEHHREAVSNLNKRTVHTLLGHKDPRMTMRYFHLSPEHLKEAVQNLDKSLTLKEGFRENSFQQSIP